MTVTFSLNGSPRQWDCAPGTTLLELLRARGFLGAKDGCDTGNCGLCTVWLDGKPVLSCCVPAARAEGRQVTTIEGVRREAALVGRYLAERGAEQCGYCSPGLVMTVLALERELPEADDRAITAYLAGNLCRCSGYVPQLEGIRAYLRRERI